MSKSQVIKFVSAALKKRINPSLKNTELLVLADGIYKRENWWYVPVYPKPETERLYDVYDSLAMAAEELDDTGLKIQLVPAHLPENN